MLPSLPTANLSALTTVSVPPPRWFRPPQGRVSEVEILPRGYTTQGLGSPKGHTGAQKNGLRYEAKVQVFFASLWPTYTASPYVRFRDESGWRHCIPDGLLTFKTHVVLFEIKSQHMPDAWWQLRRLYIPVVEAAVKRTVFPVEVVAQFDPTTPFPETFTLIEDIETYVEAPSKFGVYPWKY